MDAAHGRMLPWLMAASIVAAGVVHDGSVAELAKITLARAGHTSYVIDQEPDTALLGGETSFEIADGHFEASMASFYEHLLQSQQPLGNEFEAVLAKNLWDLYAD